MRVCVDDPCFGPLVGVGHLWVPTSYFLCFAGTFKVVKCVVLTIFLGTFLFLHVYIPSCIHLHLHTPNLGHSCPFDPLIC